MARVSRATASLKEAGWQSAGLTHRKRMRRCIGVRRPKSSKPKTCPERCNVDPTGISVESGCAIPGGDLIVCQATGYRRRRSAQKSAEGIVAGDWTGEGETDSEG